MRVHIGQRGVDHADGAIGHRLAGIDAGGALGQLLLDQAELGDGLAERLALLGVLNGVAAGRLRAPPTQAAPSLKRPMFRMLNAMWWPLPISPSRFSTGTLQSARISGQVDEPRMPSLCSSAPDREPGRAALDDEGRELLAVDLGEDREHVGEAAVGDPHLLAVEDVVLAVRREHRARAAVHGVGSRRRFRQRVGADPFAGRQLRQILLLLRLGAVPDDRQRADADVRAERHREAAQLAHRFGDQRRRSPCPSRGRRSFGDVDGHQAQLAGLAQQRRVTSKFLASISSAAGRTSLVVNSIGGLGDLPVLLGEVLGREDILRLALLGEEAAAFHRLP